MYNFCMITQQIVGFIRQQLASGLTQEQIAASLKQSGWADADIAEAFQSSVDDVNPVATATSVETAGGSKKIVLAIAIVFIVACAAAGGFYLWNKSSSAVSEKSATENTRISIEDRAAAENNALAADVYVPQAYVRIPDANNSAVIFRTVASSTFTKIDRDFLNAFSATNTPPVNESRIIVAKYKNILAAFEAGVSKGSFQCSLLRGDSCPLNIVRDAAKIALINAFVLSADGKNEEALAYASKVSRLGQQVLEYSDEMIAFLVGGVIEKMSYQTELTLRSKMGKSAPASITAANKALLIAALRKQHKNVISREYAVRLEQIDYVTDPSKKPSYPLTSEDEEYFGEYRKVSNATTWKPEQVKKWFEDSYKISLSNVDLPCGSKVAHSTIDIGFNPAMSEHSDNYVGKTFYSTLYASLENVNAKRCEVENAITKL